MRSVWRPVVFMLAAPLWTLAAWLGFGIGLHWAAAVCVPLAWLCSWGRP